MHIQIYPLTKEEYYHLKLDFFTSDYEKLPVKDYQCWCYFKANTVHTIISEDVFSKSTFLVTIIDNHLELMHQINLVSNSHSKLMNLCNYCTLLSDIF